MKSLKLTGKSKPEEALQLPRGALIKEHYMGGYCPFEDNHVKECAKMIILNIGQKKIKSVTVENQAEVIRFAGNQLGWGAGGGYYAFKK